MQIQTRQHPIHPLSIAVSPPPAVSAAAVPPPQPDPVGPSLATKREAFLQKCVPVLEHAGGSLPVNKLQPAYQTMYKQSPRASDYGVETLKEVFRGSPLFKVRTDNSISAAQQSVLQWATDVVFG